MRSVNHRVSARQFAWFRVICGIYLFVHFTYLIPYGAEIFSSAGMLSSPALNLTGGYFPNLLAMFDSTWVPSVFLGIASIGSLLFVWGWKRNWIAFALWYLWACFYHRNNLIHTPSIPYIGWLLLACSLIPLGESRLSLKGWVGKDPRWEFPRFVYVSAWILLGLGYSLSGFDKLWNSPSWRNGEAISLILQTPLAREYFFTVWILSLPSSFLHVLSWATVCLELGFGIFCLFSILRPWAWFGMVGLHLGLLLSIDFADLTLGMLVFHLFVYDSRWSKKRFKFNWLHTTGN